MFNKYFPKLNDKKLIIELVGNPGCGKSSTIRKLNALNKTKKYKSFNQIKINKLFNIFMFIKFFIFNFINIFNSFLNLISICKLFFSPNNEKSFFTKSIKIKKLFSILINSLFKIYRNEYNYVFVECITHQLIKSNFEIHFFLNKLRYIYGYHDIQFVFIYCPIEESIERMQARGDAISIKNKEIKDRYINSQKTHIFLYEQCLKEYLNSKLKFKPILINCKNDLEINARQIIKELNLTDSFEKTYQKYH